MFACNLFEVTAAGSNPIVEGFIDVVRLAWTVHLMLIQDWVASMETLSSFSGNDMENIHSCLKSIFSNNVFKFLIDKVLRTTAYLVCVAFLTFFSLTLFLF